MDMGYSALDGALPGEKREEAVAELWAEHGWALSGWHVGGILALIVAASALAQVAG